MIEKETRDEWREIAQSWLRSSSTTSVPHERIVALCDALDESQAELEALRHHIKATIRSFEILRAVDR